MSPLKVRIYAWGRGEVPPGFVSSKAAIAVAGAMAPLHQAGFGLAWAAEAVGQDHELEAVLFGEPEGGFDGSSPSLGGRRAPHSGVLGALSVHPEVELATHEGEWLAIATERKSEPVLLRGSPLPFLGRRKVVRRRSLGVFSSPELAAAASLALAWPEAL